MQKHALRGFAGVAGASILVVAAACGGANTVTEITNPGDAGSSGSSGSTDEASMTDETGTTDEAGTTSDAGPLFTMPTVCTSKTTWTRGNRGSSSMHPGVACIDCHDTMNAGPILTIAGTVYPTGHEPDDCNGIAGTGASVVITDKNGTVTTIAVNSVGNFTSAAAIVTPFTAKVVSGGKERAMTAAQTVGDCNTCHTETGTKKAPGRIVAP